MILVGCFWITIVCIKSLFETSTREESKISFNTRAGFYTSNPLTIRFVGFGSDFKNFINNLVEDFNTPKFGNTGEQYDEEK